MRRLILTVIAGLTVCSTAFGDSVSVSTTVSALIDKVGNADRPGLLFKFELPAELQLVPSGALEKARIDLAYLHFKVETDSTQKALGLLVRPMLQSWASGTKLSSLSDSTASLQHVNFGRLLLNNGSGKVEITQAVKAWQTGELSNFGLLVYPDEEKGGSFQLKNLPDGEVAELEIFYTGPEVKK